MNAKPPVAGQYSRRKQAQAMFAPSSTDSAQNKQGFLTSRNVDCPCNN